MTEWAWNKTTRLVKPTPTRDEQNHRDGYETAKKVVLPSPTPSPASRLSSLTANCQLSWSPPPPHCPTPSVLLQNLRVLPPPEAPPETLEKLETIHYDPDAETNRFGDEAKTTQATRRVEPPPSASVER